MSEQSRVGINHLFIAMSLAILGLAIGFSVGQPVAGSAGGIAVGGLMLFVFSRIAKANDP